MDVRLTALLGDQRLGPFLVSPSGESVIGRGAASDLTLDEGWVPRILATLVPTDRCWLIVNGPSVPIQVHNKWVKSELSRRAIVALPEGDTQLSWPALADPVRLKLRIGLGVADGLEELRPKADDLGDLHDLGTALTAHPVADLEWTQRHAIAVLFRHLIERTTRPANIYSAAAVELETTEDAIKKQLRRVRDRLNRERFQKLHRADEVGEYLVNVARLVTSADLERENADAELFRAARRRVARRAPANRPPGDGS